MKKHLMNLGKEIGIYFIAITMIATQGVPVGLALPIDATEGAEDQAIQTHQEAQAEAILQLAEAEAIDETSLNSLIASAISESESNNEESENAEADDQNGRSDIVISAAEAYIDENGWRMMEDGTIANNRATDWLQNRDLEVEADVRDGTWLLEVDVKNAGVQRSENEVFALTIYARNVDGVVERVGEVDVALDDNKWVTGAIKLETDTALKSLIIRWDGRDGSRDGGDKWQFRNHDHNLNLAEIRLVRGGDATVAAEMPVEVTVLGSEAINVGTDRYSWRRLEDDSVVNNLKNITAEYRVHLEAGKKMMKLEGMNHGGPLPSGFEVFQLEVSINGVKHLIKVPASDIRKGTAEIEFELEASEEVIIEVTNLTDAFQPFPRKDANFNLHNFSLYKMPIVDNVIPFNRFPAVDHLEDLQQTVYGCRQGVMDCHSETKFTFRPDFNRDPREGLHKSQGVVALIKDGSEQPTVRIYNGYQYHPDKPGASEALDKFCAQDTVACYNVQLIPDPDGADRAPTIHALVKEGDTAVLHSEIDLVTIYDTHGGMLGIPQAALDPDHPVDESGEMDHFVIAEVLKPEESLKAAWMYLADMLNVDEDMLENVDQRDATVMASWGHESLGDVSIVYDIGFNLKRTDDDGNLIRIWGFPDYTIRVWKGLNGAIIKMEAMGNYDPINPPQMSIVDAINERLAKMFGEDKLSFKPDGGDRSLGSNEYIVGRIYDENGDEVVKSFEVAYTTNEDGSFNLYDPNFEALYVNLDELAKLKEQLLEEANADVLGLDFAVTTNPIAFGPGGEVTHEHLFRLMAKAEGRATIHYVTKKTGGFGNPPGTVYQFHTLVIQVGDIPNDEDREVGVVYLEPGQDYDLNLLEGGGPVESTHFSYAFDKLEEATVHLTDVQALIRYYREMGIEVKNLEIHKVLKTLASPGTPESSVMHKDVYYTFQLEGPEDALTERFHKVATITREFSAENREKNKVSVGNVHDADMALAWQLEGYKLALEQGIETTFEGTEVRYEEAEGVHNPEAIRYNLKYVFTVTDSDGESLIKTVEGVGVRRMAEDPTSDQDVVTYHYDVKFVNDDNPAAFIIPIVDLIKGLHGKDIEVVILESAPYLCADGFPEASFCVDKVKYAYRRLSNGSQDVVGDWIIRIAQNKVGLPEYFPGEIIADMEADSETSFRAIAFLNLRHQHDSISFKDVELLERHLLKGPRNTINPPDDMGMTYLLKFGVTECPGGPDSLAPCRYTEHSAIGTLSPLHVDEGHPVGLGYTQYKVNFLENVIIDHVILNSGNAILFEEDTVGLLWDHEEMSLLRHKDIQATKVNTISCDEEGNCARTRMAAAAPSLLHDLMGIADVADTKYDDGSMKTGHEEWYFGIPENRERSVLPALTLIDRDTYYPYHNVVDAPSYQSFIFSAESAFKGMEDRAAEDLFGVLVFNREGKFPQFTIGETSEDKEECQRNDGITVCYNIKGYPSYLAGWTGAQLRRFTTMDHNSTIEVAVSFRDVVGNQAGELVRFDLPFGGYTTPEHAPRHEVNVEREREMYDVEADFITKTMKREDSIKAAMLDLMERTGLNEDQIESAWEAMDVHAAEAWGSEKARESIADWKIGFNYKSEDGFGNFHPFGIADAEYRVYVSTQPYPEGSIEVVLISMNEPPEDPNARWNEYAAKINGILDELMKEYENLDIPQDPVKYAVMNRAEKLFRDAVANIEEVLMAAIEDLGGDVDPDVIAKFQEEMNKRISMAYDVMSKTRNAETFIMTKVAANDAIIEAHLDMPGMHRVLNEAVIHLLNGGIPIEGLSPEGYRELIAAIKDSHIADLLTYGELREAEAVDHTLFCKLVGDECEGGWATSADFALAYAEIKDMLVRVVSSYSEVVLEENADGMTIVNLKRLYYLLIGESYPDTPERMTAVQALAELHEVSEKQIRIFSIDEMEVWCVTSPCYWPTTVFYSVTDSDGNTMYRVADLEGNEGPNSNGEVPPTKGRFLSAENPREADSEDVFRVLIADSLNDENRTERANWKKIKIVSMEKIEEDPEIMDYDAYDISFVDETGCENPELCDLQLQYAKGSMGYMNILNIPAQPAYIKYQLALKDDPEPPASLYEALMQLHNNPANLVIVSKQGLCADSTEPGQSWCGDHVFYYYQRLNRPDGSDPDASALTPRVYRQSTVVWETFEVKSVQEASIYAVAQLLIAEAAEAAFEDVTILNLKELEDPRDVEDHERFSVRYQINQSCPEGAECRFVPVEGLALIVRGGMNIDHGQDANLAPVAYYSYKVELNNVNAEAVQMAIEEMLDILENFFGGIAIEGWWPSALTGGVDANGEKVDGAFPGIDMVDFVNVDCVVAEEGNSCKYVMGENGRVVAQYANSRNLISSADGTISAKGYVQIVWQLLFKFGLPLDSEEDVKVFINTIS